MWSVHSFLISKEKTGAVCVKVCVKEIFKRSWVWRDGGGKWPVFLVLL